MMSGLLKNSPFEDSNSEKTNIDLLSKNRRRGLTKREKIKKLPGESNRQRNRGGKKEEEEISLGRPQVRYEDRRSYGVG